VRIGFDASRLEVDQRTGTEHYSWELLAALARLDRQNQYLLYCNRRPAELPPLPPNYQLRALGFPRLWTHLRLSTEMALHAPEVLFVPAHVLPLWSPRRSVVTIHDLGYLHYPEAHPASRRLYLRLSTRWNAWRATHVIADSEATRRDIVRYCRVPKEKVTVAYLGVDGRFAPILDQARLRDVQARYRIATPYLLYVGTIQPRKNLTRLIDAWASYLRDAPVRDGRRPLLVIAGKRGWLTERIERRAHELGIADHVHFTGYVAGEDLPALLSGALGFLLPSLYEGFGLPILEAQACGVPVLASSVSSLPEVAGDAAIFVDPLDTASIAGGIARLVEDAPLRERLRTHGLEHAAGWTWERTARTTLSVIEAVAGGALLP
jgi:glycosyltransferase involved in cell wall biosynthesis